jgi:hypothetical protein
VRVQLRMWLGVLPMFCPSFRHHLRVDIECFGVLNGP